MAKPEWCLVVKTTYLMPASLASAAQSLGSNLRGLKALGSSSKNRLVGFVSDGERMRNHDASLAVNRPVDEQTDSLVAKPLDPLRPIQRS